MKAKKEIAEAEKILPSIQDFPSNGCCMFAAFERRLREIVYANLGSKVANTLEYDVDEHVYYVELEVKRVSSKPHNAPPLEGYFSYNIGIQHCGVIDPEKKLAPQIETLVKRKEFIQSQADKLWEATRKWNG